MGNPPERLLRQLQKTKTSGAFLGLLSSHADTLLRTKPGVFLQGFQPVSWSRYLLTHPALFGALLNPRTRVIEARDVYERRWDADDFHSHKKRMTRLREYLVDGAIYHIPEGLFSVVFAGLLLRLFREHLDERGPIVEFGCGAGRNLLLLRQLFPNAPLYGFDLTDAGITAATRLAESCSVAGLQLGTLDLTDGPAFRSATETLRAGAPTIVTIGCLEAIPHATTQLVEQFIALQPRRAMCVEPLYELHARAFPWRDTFVRHHLRAGGYQRTLLTALREAESQGKIRIRTCRRLGYGKVLLEYSLVVWEPVM